MAVVEPDTVPRSECHHRGRHQLSETRKRPHGPKRRKGNKQEGACHAARQEPPPATKAALWQEGVRNAK